MGTAASSGNGIPRVSSAPLRGRAQATLLVNGSAKRGIRGNLQRPTSSSDVGVDIAAMRKISQRRKRAEAENDEETNAMTKDSDPATLNILNAVKEADSLPEEKASLKLQFLRGCYPFLEQVPSHRFDHLAVLVYQKEGDVYFTQGDRESAKTTYSRAIQIAETRVARGEKEIYMVLKRYVLAMVGMARLWYEQERDTTGFTFANKNQNISFSLDESIRSNSSRESSVMSDGSIFSLNQEILKSMATKEPRRRAGPAINVVRLLRPTVVRTHFSAEDDFVLRSQMTRELKASPCELLLLRCIEVVEIGHRRQSELLIPALIELAQIYEDLQLYNRSLLLVRRCLGILCVVYDYDHPWVIQLRRREEYLMNHMEVKLRDDMATKIQATWKMHKAMCQLEETLGRPVTRHVWIPERFQDRATDTSFLREFVNDLPAGTVLHGGAEEPLRRGGRSDGMPSPLGVRSEAGSRVPSPSPSPSSPPYSSSSPSPAGNVEERGRAPYITTVYPPSQHDTSPAGNTIFMNNARVLGTAQDTQTDTQVQETVYGGLLTIRTTTVTRTVTEQEVGSDEEDSIDGEEQEEYEELANRGVAKGIEYPTDEITEVQPVVESSRTLAPLPKLNTMNGVYDISTDLLKPVPAPGRLLTRQSSTTNETSSTISADIAFHAESIALSEPTVSYGSSTLDSRRRMRVWKASS